MTPLLAFVFDNSIGKLAALVAGLVALVVAFAWDQRTMGATRAVDKQNRAERAANDPANRAAEQSGAGGLRPGTARARRLVRDPSTRDD